MNPDDLVNLIEHRAWVPLAALVVGLIVRLLKDDTILPTIPANRRYLAAFGFGILSGVLEKVVTGTTWTSAIVGGVFTGGLAILGHEGVINALRNGKELPILPKGLLIPGASPAPGKPISLAPEPLGPDDDTKPVIIPKEDPSTGDT